MTALALREGIEEIQAQEKALTAIKIALLQKLAERLEKKNKAPAIHTIKVLMAKHGTTVAHLAGAKCKPVAAKYFVPESGKT